MRFVTAFATVLVVAVLGGVAHARDTEHSGHSAKVAINSRGEATGKPDTMRITLYAEATSGNASDALRQCGEKAATAAESIAGLGIAGAAVTREMFQFGSPASGDPFAFPPQAAPPSGTRVSQLIRVEAPLEQPVDQDALAARIASVVDAATRNGVGLGGPPSSGEEMFGQPKKKAVEYLLKDDSALHAAAVQDAFAVMDSMREQLAEVGVRTGQLLSVRHYVVGGSGEWEPIPMGGTGEKAPDVTSGVPDAISVAVQLSCEYALAE